MEMNDILDLVVIGSGPSGAAAAIAAAGRGLRVSLLEAGRYPRHKVCGEFVSAEAAEVLRYLLGNQPAILRDAPRINVSRLHAGTSMVSMPLAQPAYSIPRIKLDEVLWQAAKSRGIDCRILSATSVANADVYFEVETGESLIRSRSVINASGRWSRISSAAPQGEPWIGLKAHFSGQTDDAVDLYFTDDGYCGVQAVSPGVLNACALVKQGCARQLSEVFLQNISLHSRSRHWTQIMETFATAPVYLGPRTPLRDGILQVGDAAGFVDPFVGDGISLALRSGVLAGRTVLDRTADEYARLYTEAFSGIFRASRRLRLVLAASNACRPWLIHAVRIPAVGRRIFHSTRAAQLDILSPCIQ
jgi:flavin-dependent dehydrogenase